MVGTLAQLVGWPGSLMIGFAAKAAAQAVASYAMSALYVTWASYTPLFAISGLILVAVFLLVLLSRGVQQRHTHLSAQQLTNQGKQ